MKKIYLLPVTLILLALVLTSCSRIRYNSPVVMSTAMPEAVMAPRVKPPSGEEEASPTPTPQEESSADESNFLKMRQAALALVPEGEGLEQQVLRALIGYEDKTIVLAKILPYEIDEEIGSFDFDALPGSTQVMMVASQTIKLSSGALAESQTAAVPILVTTDNESGRLKNVYIPDTSSLEKREADIKSIFGVESEQELGLVYDSPVFEENKRELAALKYQIAISGGFDGFQNAVTAIVSKLNGSAYLDATEQDGAIRGYFLKSTFSYTGATLAGWHELGREEEGGRVKIYAAMYLAPIYDPNDADVSLGMYYVPAVIEMELSDGIWSVTDATVITSDGQEFIDAVNANFGGYAQQCLDFSGTEQVRDITDSLEQIQNSLIDGTFDPNK